MRYFGTVIPKGITLLPDKPLQAVILAVEAACRRAKRAPESVFGELIRQAIDEVLDGPRTGRFRLDQLDQTEKAYIGTRIEHIIQAFFGFGPGTLADVKIADTDVDVKWSKTLDWMIAPENVGGIILGIGLSKGEDQFSVGIFRASDAVLRKKGNRDGKRSLTAESREVEVSWLVRAASLPPNFLDQIPDSVRRAIFASTSAQQRMAILARELEGTAIPRSAFETIAQGRFDPMRRLRRDKGKVDPLGGMVFLSTKCGRQELKRLGYKHFPKDHWIPVRAEALAATDTP